MPTIPFTHLMTTEFEVLKKTSARSGAVVEETWASDGSKYFGRYDPLPATLALLNDKQTYLQESNFYCSSAVPVEEGDRITFNSVVFDVLSVVEPFDANHHFEILIERTGR